MIVGHVDKIRMQVRITLLTLLPAKSANPANISNPTTRVIKVRHIASDGKIYIDSGASLALYVLACFASLASLPLPSLACVPCLTCLTHLFQPLTPLSSDSFLPLTLIGNEVKITTLRKIDTKQTQQ
jgi:hypothetical protein